MKTINNKKELIQLSNDLKTALTLGKLPEAYYFCNGMNEMLKLYYNVKSEMKTFNEWKKAGYKIIKGSKAYKFWSKPINAKSKKTEEQETQEEYKFFGMCLLFSTEQVEKK